MITGRVPVEFWGYLYPFGNMEIKYNPKTKFWTYTGESALYGDRPYIDWIKTCFKPDFETKKEGVRYIYFVRDLVFDKDSVPIKMQYGIIEYLELPEHLKNDIDNWNKVDCFKPNPRPRPDDSMYERIVNLDTEMWQESSAILRKRGIY